MKITQAELNEVLRKHKLWLDGENGGVRADLRRADLIGTVLSGTDLRRADLSRADMCCADLRDADLCDADLFGADLFGADIRNADLCRANLIGAYLRRSALCDAVLSSTDLRRADLFGAVLSCADLCRANLSRADFRRADLSHAVLRGATLYGAQFSYAKGLDTVIVDETTQWFKMQCPEEGSYIGYKNCIGNLIVELEIPADAKRSSATMEECRASKAKVLSITKLDGSPANTDSAVSIWDDNFIYKVGETVEVSNFDDDRWSGCAHGIHHFINRQDAVKY